MLPFGFELMLHQIILWLLRLSFELRVLVLTGQGIERLVGAGFKRHGGHSGEPLASHGRLSESTTNCHVSVKLLPLECIFLSRVFNFVLYLA